MLAPLCPEVEWAPGLRDLLRGAALGGQRPEHEGPQLVQRAEVGHVARHDMFDPAGELCLPHCRLGAKLHYEGEPGGQEGPVLLVCCMCVFSMPGWFSLPTPQL